jgi:uracil-DNA glycosylase family 4
MNKRATFVPSIGDINSNIILVGDQPNKLDVYSRKPFVSPIGAELDNCLNIAKISRLQCYITNVIKDLDNPMEYYIKLGKTNNIISEDGQVYIDELKAELSKSQANIIVAIGDIPLYVLTNRKGIMKWRGSVLESTLLPGRKVIPIAHPSTILRPKCIYLNKRLIIADLVKVNEESAFPEIRQAYRDIKIEPTYYETIMFLKECIRQGLEGKYINFDIEVYHNEISCISFAYSEFHTLSVPFLNSYGDYFPIEQEIEIWKLIAELLENKDIIKSNQNIGFDNAVLLSLNGIKTHNVVDTMINQKILYPDYPAGLDFITSMYTDVPYYKDDGKIWFKVGGTWPTLWHYNGLDSVVCLAALPKQEEDLRKQGNIKTAIRQTNIVEPLVYMMCKGIKVDINEMKKSKIELEEKLTNLQKELNEKADFELNPNSPKQLINYFYTHLGHKPYLKKGKITTDDTALIRLLRKGVKEAAIIKNMRTTRKILSNYLNTDKIDKDNRIRCSYNPVGTVTGRISSSRNIFGTGGNLQNYPHHILKFLTPDDGYVFYSFDLSQAENRIVAYVGRIPRMMDAFKNNKDVHSLTASLIFNKSVDEISDVDGSSSLGGGLHSERFWGKKTNHELNYDLGYKAFALQMEIPESEAKWIVNRYHSIYPEIRGNYHHLIKIRLAKDRTILNLFNRKRLFLDAWGDDLFKKAYAQIPQSTVADKINEHGLSYIYFNQDKFKDVELLIQVHDSVGFQIPLTTPWSKHAEMLLDIKKSLETPLIWNDVEFTIPADLFMGINLFKEDGKELKHNNIPNSISKFAEKLETTYNEITMKGSV